MHVASFSMKGPRFNERSRSIQTNFHICLEYHVNSELIRLKNSNLGVIFWHQSCIDVSKNIKEEKC